MSKANMGMGAGGTALSSRHHLRCKLNAISFFAALISLSAGGRAVAGEPRATLNLSSDQYFRSSEPYYREGAEKQMTSMQIDLAGQAEKRRLFGKFHLRDQYQANEDFHYFKPFELYGGWRGERTQVYAGRKLHLWSEGDQFWRRGLWQPRFTDDKLALEEAGLTGVFLQSEMGRSRFTAFATGIYVPELGPNFNVENNQFVSKNPWFRPPGSVVNISGIPTDMRYQLDRPDVATVANHGGAAVQWEVQPSEATFVRMGAAYKPMNSLMFGFPLTLNLTDPKYGSVRVTPRILYQRLMTLETGVHQQGGWHGWVSLTQEDPVRDNPPPEWTTQEAKAATIGSAYLGYDLRGEGIFATHAYVGYTRVQGGDAPDRGEITGKQSFFERRYQLIDAARLGLRHSFAASKYGLTFLDTSFTYDFAQHGIVYSAAVRQPVAKYWTINLSADFIGLADTTGSVQDGFMSLYRANDRYSLGVSYVF